MSNIHKNMNYNNDDNLLKKISINEDVKKFVQFLKAHEVTEKGTEITHTIFGKMFGFCNRS